MSDLADLQAGDFQACVGESARVDTEAGPVDLLIDSVSVRGPGFKRPEAFAVLFVGPPDVPLGQGMRPLENPRLHGHDIFLVPVGRDERGYRYEAIFN